MTAFSVTWDYRCPFARNAHHYVLDALEGGAKWNVTFVPFSLGQVHVAEGESPIWDRPEQDSGLLALQAGVAVRDQHPDAFLAVHRALFDARHESALDLRDPDVIAKVLHDHGLDPLPVFDAVADGSLLARIRSEHEAVARSHQVWGVPTFIRGDDAAFVRLMDRPEGDAVKAQQGVERVLDLMAGMPELNEFKHTSIPR